MFPKLSVSFTFSSYNVCMYFWLPVDFIVFLIIWFKVPFALLLSVRCWVSFRPRCTLEQGLPNPGLRPSREPSDWGGGAWTLKIMKLAAFSLLQRDFIQERYSKKKLRNYDEFLFQFWQVTNLTHSFFYSVFVWILYMFRATLCSSSGGQLY
jgi:hypothetical protein